MNFYFVEILDEETGNWKRFDEKRFERWGEASRHAHDNSLRDETHYFRINCEFDDRFANYGPCH